MASKSANTVDVAVIGGGVIGLACAWAATRRGLSVAVLDRDHAGGEASPAAAGMLAPVSEAQAAERPLLELGLEAARRWAEFAAELRDAAGLDPGHRRSGTLLVARDADDAEALERELALRESLGLSVERLRPSAARGLEPALAPTVRLALLAAEDHSVDPRRLLAALAAAITRAGGAVRRAEVTAVETSGGAVSGVTLAGGERVSAGRVVVAAGAWSAGLAGLDPETAPPVRPVKGQILRLRDPAGPGLCTRVLRMADAYLVPRDDGGYVLGATMEDRGFDTQLTAGATFTLLRGVSEVLPGVLELDLVEAGAGLRPATPDNAPAIGADAHVDGLVWAVGHHRNGVLLAPVTADLVAAALAGDADDERWTAFAPGRFAKVAA